MKYSTVTLRAFLGLAAILSMGGCNILGPFGGKTVVKDTNPDRVWYSHGDRAKGREHTRWDFVRVNSSLVWISKGGKKSRGDEVMDAADAALELHGGQPGSPGMSREQTRTIACIDPLIILIADEPWSRRQGETSLNSYWMVHSKPLAATDFQRGYRFSSRTPIGKGLWLISPSFEAPREVEFDTLGWHHFTVENEQWVLRLEINDEASLVPVD